MVLLVEREFVTLRYGPQELVASQPMGFMTRLRSSFPHFAWLLGKPVPDAVPFREVHRCRMFYALGVLGYGLATLAATAGYQALTWQLYCQANSEPCIDQAGEPTYNEHNNSAAITYLILQTISFHVLTIGDLYRCLRRY
eukprot:scaffold307822_cov42-Prasinocladus_malaysianus.AAC.1